MHGHLCTAHLKAQSPEPKTQRSCEDERQLNTPGASFCCLQVAAAACLCHHSWWSHMRSTSLVVEGLHASTCVRGSARPGDWEPALRVCSTACAPCQWPRQPPGCLEGRYRESESAPQRARGLSPSMQLQATPAHGPPMPACTQACTGPVSRSSLAAESLGGTKWLD